MKRMCACLLILALCMSVLPMGVSAKAFELSDLTYTIENGEVTITGCNWKVHGTVELPAVIEGYPVTVIGKNAFMSCLDIKKIVVPEGVHTIEAGGFAHCTQLAELIIPDSILRIGENALNNSYRIKYNEYDNGKYLGNEGNPYLVLAAAKNQNITSCIIHEDTKVLAAGAFESCQNLLEIEFPDSVVTIGYSAFYQCTSLTIKSMGVGVKEVGNLAFYNCKLEHSAYGRGTYFAKGENPYYYLSGNMLYSGNDRLVVHPDTKVLVTRSLSYSALTYITLPEGLWLIRPYAFFSSRRLSEITIPATVEKIQQGAFGNCMALKNIYFCGDAPAIEENVFEDIQATAWYHPNTNGWTEETMQSYGGDITWVETHFYKNGVCTVCGESETGEIPVRTALSGSVNTAGSGDAMIELYAAGEAAPTRVLKATDAYSIDALLTGDYVITVYKQDHVTRSYPVTLTEEAAVLDLKLQLLGDINGDGKRNVGDVSKIYSHTRKKALITDEYLLSCADLTGDGRVNIGDTADAYAYIKYSN